MLSVNLIAAIVRYVGTYCVMYVAVVNNIELTKRIVTLSGLRWKMISKMAASPDDPVESKDVFKRFLSGLCLCSLM